MWRLSIFTALLILSELVIGILFTIDAFNNNDLTRLKQSLLIAKLAGDTILVGSLIYYMRFIGQRVSSLQLLNTLTGLFCIDALIRFLTKAKFPADELHIENYNDLFALFQYIVQIYQPLQIFVFALQRELAINQIIRGVLKDPTVQKAMADETVLIKDPKTGQVQPLDAPIVIISANDSIAYNNL